MSEKKRSTISSYGVIFNISYNEFILSNETGNSFDVTKSFDNNFKTLFETNISNINTILKISVLVDDKSEIKNVTLNSSYDIINNYNCVLKGSLIYSSNIKKCQLHSLTFLNPYQDLNKDMYIESICKSIDDKEYTIEFDLIFKPLNNFQINQENITTNEYTFPFYNMYYKINKIENYLKENCGYEY